MKRTLLVVAAALILLFLVGSVALWLFFSSWLPTTGKTRIIEALERQAPIDVSMDAIRYQFVRGFVVEGARVADRASHEVWLAAPSMRVQVAWLPLLVQRQLAFRAETSLEAPCRTELFLLGRYRLRDKSLTLDARTTDVSLRTVVAPLRRYLPAALTDGALRLTIRITRSAQEPPVMTGRVLGTRLVWTGPAIRMTADVTLNGSATSPRRPGDSWTIDSLISLRDGTVEGLPTLGTISRLAGDARLSGDRLTIQTLTGMVLGSPWTLEGDVGPLAQPSLDVLLSSRVDAAKLSAAVPSLKEPWGPGGSADVRAVCRGPLQLFPRLDCLVDLDAHDLRLSGTKFPQPVTEIRGSLAYDVLARRLSIKKLEGRLLGESLSVLGDAAFAPETTLSLDVSGTMPLEMLMGWLPRQSLIAPPLGGRAALKLRMEGPLRALRYTGQAELSDVGIRFASPAHTIDRLTASVLLNTDEINFRGVSFQLDGQPVTLVATITPGTVPRIVATAGFPQAEVWFTSRLTPQEVVIDQGQVSLAKSRVYLSGTISRTGAGPSALNVSGVVELAELTNLPFFPLPQLESWNLQGLADVEAEFQGRFEDWPSASMRGRFQADHLSVREIPLEQLVCLVEQNRSVLRVRIPSALIAEGKLQSELVVEHREKTRGFVLQADLVGLQLARLAQAIPAWRSRSVMGSASASATLSGTWEERPTWRGEGWFNVSGERLGDMPLLDKVFRGLFGVLADRLGLETLRRAQITQASMRWQLAQERFRTEDLRIGGLAGAEPVAVYGKGSVGLDQTLDVVIEPELSEGAVLESPTTSTLATTVLKAAGQLERFRQLIGRHRITGTLNDPVYRFEFTPDEILKQLAPGPVDLLQNIFGTIR